MPFVFSSTEFNNGLCI
jgi:hypothetical protein